jgi:hypothetical protein
LIASLPLPLLAGNSGGAAAFAFVVHGSMPVVIISLSIHLSS